MSAIRIERWTPLSVGTVAVSIAVIVFLATGPGFFSADVIDKLTRLFIYVILAAMWNALAGYGGLVSVGQQAFFGLGAYAAIRLANFGVNPYLALFLAAAIVGVASLPASTFMLRLKAGEFAIGMWVLAEIAHLVVNLDPLINGETGTSYIQLNVFETGLRNALTYWSALGAMTLLLGIVFFLLRSRTGSAIQAIRDDEEAAASIGVRVRETKRLIFVLAALGAAMAGALWVATAITFQPKSYFSVQWTAYMIFMVLVGGIGTFEGAIIGAVIFFLIEAWFGASGVWYLIGLGATALVFALFLPRGMWGQVEDRLGITLLPVGYRLRGIDEVFANRRGRIDMIVGKVIVITGVSSGIGARTAELARAQGAEVIGIDLDEPAVAMDFVQADLSSAAEIAIVAKRLPRRIDALCNIAGLSGKVGAAKTLAVNFYGLGLLSEILAPRIREGGAVVNIASIAGFGWRANLDARQGAGRHPGHAGHLWRSPRISACPTTTAIPSRRRRCCCGPCGPPTTRYSRLAASASTQSAPARSRRRS